MSHNGQVRQISRGQAARILAVAFADDPTMVWLFPDADERKALLPTILRHWMSDATFLDSIEEGGAAVWDRKGPHGGTGEADGRAAPDAERQGPQVPDGFEPYRERLILLDELLEPRHPTGEDYLFLSLIGVRPEASGQGIGGRLLEYRLAWTDRERLPAYLEATSGRSARLYSRYGFEPLGDSVVLPDGPALHPMWRAAGDGRG